MPVSERRTLLEDWRSPVVWRTPASVVVERCEDFVARVEELGLEGVVAKPSARRTSPGAGVRPG